MKESDEILTNIRKILRSINLESKRIQKEYGISIPQLLSLNYLSEIPNYQSTVKAISEHLNLNSSTVSGIIKRLESKGLVAKLPNPNDRRGSIIALTEKGAKLVKSTPGLLHDRLDQNLSRLQPGELETVRKGLDLLIGLMGVEEIDASPILVAEEAISIETDPKVE